MRVTLVELVAPHAAEPVHDRQGHQVRRRRDMSMIGVRVGSQCVVEHPIAGRIDEPTELMARLGVTAEVTAQDGAALMPALFSELIVQ